jgi:hypothetical protein
VANTKRSLQVASALATKGFRVLLANDQQSFLTAVPLAAPAAAATSRGGASSTASAPALLAAAAASASAAAVAAHKASLSSIKGVVAVRKEKHYKPLVSDKRPLTAQPKQIQQLQKPPQLQLLQAGDASPPPASEECGTGTAATASRC